MKEKIDENIDRIWGLSLLVIGLASVVLAFGDILGLALPVAVTRCIGILDLLALPVLLYATTVRGRKKREERHEL